LHRHAGRRRARPKAAGLLAGGSGDDDGDRGHWRAGQRNRLRMTDRLRILVFGYMIRMPLGGLVWHYLQYLTGFSDLGHDVYYLEDSAFFDDEEQFWFHDPVTGVAGSSPRPGMRVISEVLRGSQLADKWALYDPSNSMWTGPAASSIDELCRTA